MSAWYPHRLYHPTHEFSPWLTRPMQHQNKSFVTTVLKEGKGAVETQAIVGVNSEPRHKKDSDVGKQK